MTRSLRAALLIAAMSALLLVPMFPSAANAAGCKTRGHKISARTTVSCAVAKRTLGRYLDGLSTGSWYCSSNECMRTSPRVSRFIFRRYR